MNGEDNGWPEEKRREFFGYLGRHLVALCGTYQVLDNAGRPAGIEKPYSYSGCVVSLNSQWYILTAGHAVKDFMSKLEGGRVLITGRVLADYFGVSANDHHPLPFDIVSNQKVYVDDENAGLDFALLRLGEMDRRLIEANGVLAFPLYVERRPPTSDFYRYVVVGFPEERVDLAPSPVDHPVSVVVQPHCIPLNRLADDNASEHPRFRAQVVEMGDLKSIVGMSGGPIFGFIDKGGSQDYYLWAVQSSWGDISRTAYGCMVDEIYADAQERLKQLDGATP